MDFKALVSVIIPAYNAENTINKCIDSIICQSYTPIEIIVVNDGSTDSTLSVLQDYSNLKIINKKNGGASSARNVGIEAANGKYIMFIDSDDWVEPDFVAAHINNMTGFEDEIVMSDFIIENRKEHDWPGIILNGQESIFSEYIEGGICNRTVNKIYPKGIIDTIPFPEGRDVMEDAYWTSMVLEKCRRVIRINYAGYHYEMHEESLSKRKHLPKELSGMYANCLDQDIIIIKHLPNDKRIMTRSMSDISKVLLSPCDMNVFSIKEKIRWLASQCLENPQISTREKENCKLIMNSNDLEKDYSIFIIKYGNKNERIQLIKKYIKKMHFSMTLV